MTIFMWEKHILASELYGEKYLPSSLWFSHSMNKNKAIATIYIFFLLHNKKIIVNKNSPSHSSNAINKKKKGDAGEV